MERRAFGIHARASGKPSQGHVHDGRRRKPRVDETGKPSSKVAIAARTIRAKPASSSRPPAASSWALLHNHVTADPTQLVKIKPSKSKGHTPWDEDDIIKFEARWPRGTRQRVMLDVYCYTGVRRGDAAKVGRQHVEDGTLVFDTEKNDMRVTIPILPMLRETLEAGPVGDLAFIAKKNGDPLNKKTLGNAFRAACKAAGIIGKSAHGLRKAAATRAANNGYGRGAGGDLWLVRRTDGVALYPQR